MKNLANVLGKISFSIAVIMIFLCVNYFARLIPIIKTSSFILFMPIYICPIGIVLAILSLAKGKNKWAILAVVLNGAMFLMEFLFVIMGARLLR